MLSSRSHVRRNLCRILCGAWLSLVATAGLTARAEATPGVAAPSRPLVVGSELDYPPFALVRPDGTADGFTVALWKAVAQQAGLQYEIKIAPFHELLQEFKDGKLDVLICLAHSDARKQFTDFSVPYVTMYGAAFVRDGDERIASEQDLPGKSLIVLQSDLVQDYALARGWTHLVPVETTADAMRLLASGKHDAVLIGKLVGLQTLHELALPNIRPVPARLNVSQKFAFAVPRGNAELLARINEGLALVKAGGTYDALYEQWFGVLEPRRVTFGDVLRLATPYLVPSAIVFVVIVIAYARQTQLRRRLEVAKVRLAKVVADLDRSNRELESFAQVVSHDLRAPLRALRYYSRFLEQDYTAALGAEGRQYVEGIADSALRMDALVVGLLEYSRIGRVEAEATTVDIGELLDQVVTTLRLRDKADVALPSDAPAIWGRALRLQQIFSNLMDNAVKYQRKDARPQVVVEWADRGDCWELAVRDNGIGIDLKFKDKLFGMFQRLHADGEYEGTGIGLAIVKKAVEEHGGTIWVESAPGQGSVFRFTIAKPAKDEVRQAA